MRQKYWSTEEELRPLFPIFGLFGLSSLAITYVTSRLFSNASYGFVSLTIFFLLTGTTLFKLISILMFPILNLIEIANQLKEVFLIFPHYALAYSLYNVNNFRISNEVCLLNLSRLQKMSKNGTTDIGCNAIKCDGNIYDWDEPGIGRSLTYMTLIAVIFITILWIIEYRIIPIIFHHFAGLTQNVPPLLVTNTIDSNVINEKIKVNAMTSTDLKSNNLVLRNLSKYYGQFKAVNGISVAVKRQECFGLLGVNGAGKTTTFKMITGDTSISSGDAFINGMNLKKDLDEVHKLIGYCPQFDALLDNLTGTQTLEIFGLLRGYRRKDISAMSDRLAERLNFTKHIDKVIKSYSGGNKRKLSTAIALMGTPSVVYLDEPSSGMDPGSKKNLWDFVSQVRNSGTSIVLTSHSMEECEALCNRIAIMVNGEFKCLGSAQHLKSQFSKGFILTIKIRLSEDQIERSEQISRINYFIHDQFPGAYLKEQYQGLLTFYLPHTSELKWSTLFDYMENVKRELGVEDYTISQTTLEQVFLSFARTHYKRCQNISQQPKTP
ncbi:ATP-binding cassette sub-family A member 3-like [Contarinia nasturtii]|uniref:ATP-binding cassette sub-family A member 3-like n=1 Tax=Contarinia nasturtii TaxID=265458 RepID=UPI0012D488E0|nr:ATP-binding cassette sub-family A member 3-like [Contarinia nasturtii]